MSTTSQNSKNGYVFQNSNKLSRFFWWCAGADERLLDEHCPPSDHVKYFCLGGIVLATGFLAFVSSSYAFYTVFAPKGKDAMDAIVNTEWILISCIMGIIWGYIIFNLDRFIISSTGKGDGKDSISTIELKNAAPRLIMAIILGIVISAPLETRILKTEIDAELSIRQSDKLKEYNARTDSSIDRENATWQSKIDPIQKRIDDQKKYINDRKIDIKDQRRSLDLEAEGKSANGKAGIGGAWKSKKENLDKMEKELDDLTKKSEEGELASRKEIENYKNEIRKGDSKRISQRIDNEKRAQALDGLLERILISHELSFLIPLFILGMFLCIETGPILFKLMMSKTPYDYLIENQKELIKAKAGILVQHQSHNDGSGKEVELVRYLGAEKESQQFEDKTIKEINTNKAVLDAWEQKKQKDISANPNEYLSES